MNSLKKTVNQVQRPEKIAVGLRLEMKNAKAIFADSSWLGKFLNYNF